MVGYLAKKWQKRIAWIFFNVFYLQMFLSAFPNYYSQAGILNSYEFCDVVLHNIQKVSSGKERNKPLTHTLEGVLQSINSGLPGKPKLHYDIGGPGQPEMSSFKSVGTDNMVNLFTGDFSYSIPLLDVGGYPVNLFYNAGITMDQDASWVGLGWNINPGTVSRNMRGLPDDFDGSVADGDKIVKTQNIKEDVTIGVNVGANKEIAGYPLPIKGSVDGGISWNNKRGISIQAGGNFSVEYALTRKSGTEKTTIDTVGGITGSAGGSLNSQNGLSLNAGFEIDLKKGENFLLNGLGTSVDYNSQQGLSDLRIEGESNLYKNFIRNYALLGAFPDKLGYTISFARPSYTPTIRMPLTRISGRVKIKIGGEATVVHPNGYIAASVNSTYIAENDRVQKKPAYGYMYYEKANNDQDALLDYNRINDGTYSLKTPVISIPNYTYDVFSISGEGTGGAFRGYRGNTAYIRDNYTKSRDGSIHLTIEGGVGNLFHGGTELGGVFTTTTVSDWSKDNLLEKSLAFRNSMGLYQTFYFRNPAEKAIIDEAFYNSMGGDNLMRPKLTNLNQPLPHVASSYELFDNFKNKKSDLLITESSNYRKNRDKRTQVITYLTAEEASRVGLDKEIYSYDENAFDCTNGKIAIKRYGDQADLSNYRKRHHLSEIDVLEADGKRYVYGIPVYTISQKEVSFSLDPSQGDRRSQLSTYTVSTENNLNGVVQQSGQNSVKNKSGKDAFFQSEEVPAYSHSFLLTAILSPDYSDITGDGMYEVKSSELFL